MNSSFQRILLATIAAFAAAASPAGAQNFPTKPVTIVVSNAPGDQADLVARILAPEMTKLLGQPVIVENKPGAATMIGTRHVAFEAPADGYTIAAISANALLTLPLVIKDAADLDPMRDLPPFIELFSSKLVLAANTQQSWKTYPELVAYAKANPGKLNYGSSSAVTRIMTELQLHAENINIVYIPYSATAANFQALLTNENQLGIMPESQALTGADKVRVLWQTGDSRSANFPNAPTTTELGFPQIRGSIYSLNLRAGTPKPVVDKLFTVVSTVMRDPNVRQLMGRFQGEIATPTSPEKIAAGQAEIAKGYAATAKQIGITPQ